MSPRGTIPRMTTSRPVRPSPLEGLGTPALAAGVVAAGTCWLLDGWLGAGAGLLAVVLGFVGSRRAMDDPTRNGGAALTGFVLGLVGLGVGIYFVVRSFSGAGGYGDGLTLDECMGQASGQQQQRMCATQHLDEYRARYPDRQNM